MRKTIIGNSRPVVAVVACMHGNEKKGAEVLDLICNFKFNGTLLLIVANEEAMKLDKRFVDADLNRCFPGGNGNHEEKLASLLLKETEGCDFVIDVHSTTADTDDFAVVVKEGFEGFMPVKKAVVLGDALAKGKSLLDYVPGVSVEFNCKTTASEAAKVIIGCIRNFANRKKVIQEKYHVYGAIVKGKKNPLLVNFKKTDLNGESFYPVFYGEKAYKNMLCLKASRRFPD
jgi:succinylglutamate desuccinylase